MNTSILINSISGAASAFRPKPAPRRTPNRFAGFTLIELLAVVVLIGIVSIYAVPAVGSLLKGSSLDTTANLLTDEMSRARQHAISKNRVVEVRFYRFADPEAPGEVLDNPTTGYFRGFQSFEIPAQQVSETDVPVPIGSFVRLPAGIMMNDSDGLSPLLGPTSASMVATLPGDHDPDLPQGIGKNYEALTLRFLPDGSASLPWGTDTVVSSSSSGTGPTTTTTTSTTKTKGIGKLSNGNAYGIGNGNGNTGNATVANGNGNAYGLQNKGSNNGTTTTTTTSSTGGGSDSSSTETASTGLDQWFITIHSIADKAKATESQPPPNFLTWMVDPVSGTSKVFRSSN